MAAERWRGRARTLEAMLCLCAARALVAGVPFGWWRGSLGRAGGESQQPGSFGDGAAPARLAGHIERGAARLPFATKCLPRAMALAWMLRRRGLPYALTIAVRAPQHREGNDDLHAWIEADGQIVLGDLPGPWQAVLRLGRHGGA